ncbi:MAG: cytochrome b5 domain-containing protein [Thermoplasmata archaeon]
MKDFGKAELAKYNGRDGAPAYVAYNGKVYDVSESFLWKGGKHQATHDAGKDLTDALDRAPHSADVIGKFPVVGLLRIDSTREE